MPSARDLLESAVPYEPRRPLDAAQVRRLGRRRQRRSQAIGTVVALTSVALSIAGVVRFVMPSQETVTPLTTTSPTARSSFTAQPAPSPTGPDFAALVGTRWIPDLVGSRATAQQAYPDDRGNAPRALMTFEPHHVLVLDFIENGRTTTARGTWAATSDTPRVDSRAHGSLRLSLVAPPGSPEVLALLVSRFSLASSYAMTVPGAPPPSLEALILSAYNDNNGVASFVLVKPGVRLPPPYPQRP